MSMGVAESLYVYSDVYTLLATITIHSCLIVNKIHNSYIQSRGWGGINWPSNVIHGFEIP